MSIISVGTTLTTGLSLESDTTGNLVIKTGASGVTAATFNSGGTAVIGNLSVTSASISNLSVTSITLSGVLPIVQGGTGLSSTPTNGQLLIGNGTGFTLATLTAGSGITVTNNAGSITITNSSTGGAQDYIVQSYGIV
jgi:hypothetical protein